MKTIVIVGASRGIGLEFARQLGNTSDKVYALCRTASRELRELPVEVLENCDVNNVEALKNAALQIPDKIDWLIHVAGILHRDSFENIDMDVVEAQMRTNATAPLKCVLAFEEKLQEGGKIAFLTSKMGSMTDNASGGYYGYRMSKAALNMMGVNLAIDLKPREITVLLLHPGFVQTDMTGHEGHIDAETSVKGLLTLMEEKSLKDSGTFWHSDGAQIPW